jgi:hypothetical protein
MGQLRSSWNQSMISSPPSWICHDQPPEDFFTTVWCGSPSVLLAKSAFAGKQICGQWEMIWMQLIVKKDVKDSVDVLGATQKFPKFVCLNLSNHRNFYSSPFSSRWSPSTLIQRSQLDFQYHSHWWESICFSIFITSCGWTWTFALLSKRHHLSFSLIFWNSKNATGVSGEKRRVRGYHRFHCTQKLPHREWHVCGHVGMAQVAGIVASFL